MDRIGGLRPLTQAMPDAQPVLSSSVSSSPCALSEADSVRVGELPDVVDNLSTQPSEDVFIPTVRSVKTPTPRRSEWSYIRRRYPGFAEKSGLRACSLCGEARLPGFLPFDEQNWVLSRCSPGPPTMVLFQAIVMCLFVSCLLGWIPLHWGLPSAIMYALGMLGPLTRRAFTTVELLTCSFVLSYLFRDAYVFFLAFNALLFATGWWQFIVRFRDCVWAALIVCFTYFHGLLVFYSCWFGDGFALVSLCVCFDLYLLRAAYWSRDIRFPICHCIDYAVSQGDDDEPVGKSERVERQLPKRVPRFVAERDDHAKRGNRVEARTARVDSFDSEFFGVDDVLEQVRVKSRFTVAWRFCAYWFVVTWDFVSPVLLWGAVTVWAASFGAVFASIPAVVFVLQGFRSFRAISSERMRAFSLDCVGLWVALRTYGKNIPVRVARRFTFWKHKARENLPLLTVGIPGVAAEVTHEILCFISMAYLMWTNRARGRIATAFLYAQPARIRKLLRIASYVRDIICVTGAADLSGASADQAVAGPECDFDSDQDVDLDDLGKKLPESQAFGFSPGSLLRGIGRSIAGTFGVSFSPPSDEEVDTMKGFSRSAKTLGDLKKAGTFFMPVLDFFARFSFKRIFGYAYGFDPDITKNAAEWNERTILQCDGYLKPDFFWDQTAVEALSVLYTQGQAILADLERCRVPLHNFPAFKHNFDIVAKLFRDHTGAATADRQEPVGMLVFGDGSAGKSSLCNRLARDLAVSHRVISADEKAPSTKYMYSVAESAGNEKLYRDGYRRQLTVVYKDAGNSKIPGALGRNLLDVMGVIDHDPYEMNAAAVNLKGILYMLSWYFFMNTNSDTFLYTNDITQKAYNAAMSRFTFVVKPLEFADLPKYEGLPRPEGDIRNFCVVRSSEAKRVKQDPTKIWWVVGKMYCGTEGPAKWVPERVVAYETLLKDLVVACVEKHSHRLEASSSTPTVVEVPKELRFVTDVVPAASFMKPASTSHPVFKYLVGFFLIVAAFGGVLAFWKWFSHEESESEAAGSSSDSVARKNVIHHPRPLRQGLQQISVPQGGQNLDDVAQKVIGNCVRMELYYDGDKSYPMSGVALAIADGWYLIPEHVVRYWCSWLRGDLPGEFRVYMDDVPVNPKNVVMNVEESAHLAIFKIPKRAQKPSILHLFADAPPEQAKFRTVHCLMRKRWLLHPADAVNIDRHSVQDYGEKPRTRELRTFHMPMIQSSLATQAGDSGCPVLFDPVKNEAKLSIVGVHSFGSSRGNFGIAIFVPRQWLLAAMAYSVPQAGALPEYPLLSEMRVDGEPEIAIPENCKFVGNVPRSAQSVIVGGSEFKEGPFFAALPVDRAPPELHRLPDGTRPSAQAIQKRCQPNFVVTDRTLGLFQKIGRIMMRQLPRPYRKIVLSEKEAINGARDLKYSHAMPMQTGVGFRFKAMVPDGKPNEPPVGGVRRKVKGKLAWFDSDGVFYRPAAKLSSVLKNVWNDVRVYTFAMKHNETRPLLDDDGNPVTFPPCSEDERIAKECNVHNAVRKPARPLSGEDLAWSIFDRQYLSVFADAFMRDHNDGPNAVGIDPHSRSEWLKLASWLEVDKPGRVHDCSDVKAFGPSIPAQIRRAALDLVEYWHVYHKFAPEYMKGVKHCLDSYDSALLLYIMVLLRPDCGFNDGWFLTIIINCIANEGMRRVCFVEHLIDTLSIDEDSAIALCFEDLRPKVGGDDTYATHQVLSFTPPVSAAMLKKLFGLTSTSPSKTGEIPEVYDSSDLTFYKRRVKGDGHAPLELASIYNMGCWVGKHEVLDADLVKRCANTMLYEMYHHGPVAFDVFKDVISSVLDKWEVHWDDLPCADYAFLDTVWMGLVPPPLRCMLKTGDFLDSITVHDVNTESVVQGDDEKINEIAGAPTSQTTDAITHFDDNIEPVVNSVVLPVSAYVKGKNPYPPETITPAMREHRRNATFQYTDGPGTVVAQGVYPLDLFQYTNVVDKLSFFRYVNACVRVTIRLVASPGTFGALLFAWAPRYKLQPGLTLSGSLANWDWSVLCSAFDHMLIDVTTSESVTVDIPYIGGWNYANWKDGANPLLDDSYSIGCWVVRVLAPLSTISEANAQPCQLIISEQIVELDAAGYTAVQSGRPKVLKKRTTIRNPTAGTHGRTPVTEARARTEAGTVANVAQAVDDIASALVHVPVVGGVAAAAAPLARAVGGIASLFGWDKPDYLAAALPIAQYTTPGLTAGSGVDYSRPLALDPENRVKLDTGVMNGEDFMSFMKFKNVPMIVDTFKLKVTDTAGTVVWQRPVVPTLCRVITVPAIGYHEHTTHTGNLAAAFKRWHGGMKFAVYIFAPSLARGRVSFIWTPDGANLSIAGRGDTVLKIVEIRGTTVATFTVPFLHRKEWLPVLPFTYFTNGGFSTGVQALSCNGFLSVRYEAVLNTFTSAYTPEITCVVYASAAEDMRFMQPNGMWAGNAFTPGPGANYTVVQGIDDLEIFNPRQLFQKVFDPMIAVNVMVYDKVEQGEEIMDFGTYLHSYELAGLINATNNFLFTPLQMDTFMRQLFLLRNFRFCRGSIRYVLRPKPSIAANLFASVGFTDNIVSWAGVDLDSQATRPEVIQYFGDRGAIELRVPYYNSAMFMGTDWRSTAGTHYCTYDLSLNECVAQLRARARNIPETADVDTVCYVAYGDDWSMAWLQQPPWLLWHIPEGNAQKPPRPGKEEMPPSVKEDWVRM